MAYNFRKQSILDQYSQYQLAKDTMGIHNDLNHFKIIIQGVNALSFINYYSTNFIKSDTLACYTLFMKNKTFLDEVLILKLSENKYLLVLNNLKKVYHTLYRRRKKYPLTIVYDASKEYSLFTFHGNEIQAYFKSTNFKNLFMVNHQSYQYYQLVAHKDEETTLFEYFITQGFIPISLETKKIFLYNNKVISNFNHLRRGLQKKYLNAVYKLNDNNHLIIQNYEVLDNDFIENNVRLINNIRKKCGYVFCSYRTSSNSFQKVLCLVDQLNNEMLIMKRKHKETLLRKINDEAL